MKEKSISTEEREIVVSRIVNAPRQLVWKVWTEEKHIRNWWGPNGFTNTIHKMEVKPGGHWVFIMHGPDGTNYDNHIIYDELVEPELIRYQHITAPYFAATATFEAIGEKTKITLRSVFNTAEERDRVIKAVNAVEGARQTLGRLDKYLEELK